MPTPGLIKPPASRFLALCLTWRQYAANHHESSVVTVVYPFGPDGVKGRSTAPALTGAVPTAISPASYGRRDYRGTMDRCVGSSRPGARLGSFHRAVSSPDLRRDPSSHSRIRRRHGRLRARVRSAARKRFCPAAALRGPLGARPPTLDLPLYRRSQHHGRLVPSSRWSFPPFHSRRGVASTPATHLRIRVRRRTIARRGIRAGTLSRRARSRFR